MYVAEYELDELTIRQVGGPLALRDEDAARDAAGVLFQFLEQPDAGLALRWAPDGVGGRPALHLRAQARSTDALTALASALGAVGATVDLADDRGRFDAQLDTEGEQVLSLQSGRLETSGGHPVFLDSLLIPGIDVLERLVRERDAPVCYQLNLSAADRRGEDLRELRKALVRMEEDRRVPLEVRKHQRLALERRAGDALPSEQYLSCPPALVGDLAALLESRLAVPAPAFRGFASLQRAGDEESEQFEAGLHARYLEAPDAAGLWADATTREDLERILEIAARRASVHAPAAAPGVPRAAVAHGPWDVFVSHSSQDRLLAQAVCHYLEAAGVRCWIAPRDIRSGELWAEAIMRGLAGAKLTVALVSPAAHASAYVLRELEQTVTRGKVIIPVRIADIDPNGGFGFFVSVSHWLDAVAEPFEQHLPTLLEAVRAQLAVGREANES